MKRIIIIAATSFLLIFVLVVFADELYTWTDENGQTQVSKTKPSWWKDEKYEHIGTTVISKPQEQDSGDLQKQDSVDLKKRMEEVEKKLDVKNTEERTTRAIAEHGQSLSIMNWQRSRLCSLGVCY